jgi:hypothetical protein
VNVDLPWTAYLPRDYVQGQRLRIEVYRRLSRVRRLERLADFRQELRDRFGALPQPAEWLLRLVELRLLAAQWKIASVQLEKPAKGVSGLIRFSRRAARTCAAGQVAGIVPTEVVALAEGVLRAMLFAKLKPIAGLLSVILVLAVGIGAWRHATAAGQTKERMETAAGSLRGVIRYRCIQ